MTVHVLILAIQALLPGRFEMGMGAVRLPEVRWALTQAAQVSQVGQVPAVPNNLPPHYPSSVTAQPGDYGQISQTIPLPPLYEFSIVPQGAQTLIAATSKRLPSVALVKISIRTLDGKPMDLETTDLEILAAKHGISLLDKRLGVQLVESTVAKSKRKVIADIIKIGLGLGVMITVPGVVQASTAVQTGLVYGGYVAGEVSKAIKERIPSTLWASFLLDGQIVMSGKGKASGLMLATWVKGMGPVVLEGR